MKLEDTGGHGHSLWLVPEPAQATRYRALITRFARRFDAPAFLPHVTLLSGIRNAAEDALIRTNRVARSVPPFSVDILGIGMEDAFFRCLYLALPADDRHIARLRSASKIAFGLRPPAHVPHLSLLYANLVPEVKSRLGLELASQAKAPLRCDSIELHDTRGPITEWRRVFRAPLSGAA